MRRFIAASTLAAALVLGAGLASAANLEETFVIPASDGYGIGDCLSTGAECGRVVADAYCEAQGYPHSKSFGQADASDVTGSVTKISVAPRPVSIVCSR